MGIVTPQKTNCYTVIVISKNKIIHLKGKQTMKYDITKPSAPQMPPLGKGTECIKILLSQASKDMHEPLVPMLPSPLLEHI